MPKPVLFCLHYLGGSAREWALVARQLTERYDVVALDLPGFGEAASQPGYAVAEMADAVVNAIRQAEPERWLLVGHSMGAKVAQVVARYAEDGAPGLAGLVGLVTVAGSPPGPEPIPDADRAQMLEYLSGGEAARAEHARAYVANNSGAMLDAASFEHAVSDALRASPAAWRAWLTSGSREDWGTRVGILETPALAIAGADDANLGLSAQSRLLAPHFADVRLEVIANAKHLLPYEAPSETARLIDEHATRCFGDDTWPLGGDAYRALIASDRVSRATRRALVERARPDDPSYAPVALGADAFAVLRALVARVVPQAAPGSIDLAARIDRALASGVGNGWRFADLPADCDAYRVGLATLNDTCIETFGVGFVEIDAERQDAMLAQIASGEEGARKLDTSTTLGFGASQMRSWFEDLREDAVRAYVAHPQTLARIGYSGIANGGDGLPKSGFVRVGYGEREAWEPLAQTDRAT